MNLMLVDDDKHVLEGLKKHLDWNAFEGKLTATASNGREALDLVEGTKPDVIISDIRMPVMDGISLARAIQQKHLNIDFILLSGYGEFEYAQKAIQYQVTKYILKPITRQKIDELQQMLMELSQARKHQKEDFLSNWDHSFRDQILTALRDNTPDAFDDFFSSQLFADKLRSDTSNAFGIQMLNFLYSYLSELNISPEIIVSSKEKAMNSYYDLPSIDEKSNYLIKHLLRCHYQHTYQEKQESGLHFRIRGGIRRQPLHGARFKHFLPGRPDERIPFLSQHRF